MTLSRYAKGKVKILSKYIEKPQPKIQLKICKHNGCIHNQIARPVSDFKRLDVLGRVFTHKVCNNCATRERIAARDRERFYQEVSDIALPVYRPKNKPVWMVIYRSYWP